MSVPVLIDESLLDAVAAAARTSPRLRRNHNFHHADADASHRLLNAIEPGSYVVPHRHLDPEKDETFVVLRGRFGLVLFDDDGAITHRVVLDTAGPTYGVTIPHGTFHSIVSLAAGSVFLEAKAGPYLPLTGQERAAWAPAEQETGAAAYLAGLEDLFAVTARDQ